MRKLVLVALLAAGATVGVASPASARCPEFNIECTLACAVPNYDPYEGLHWYYC